jgi:hypothetical protein
MSPLLDDRAGLLAFGAGDCLSCEDALVLCGPPQHHRDVCGRRHRRKKTEFVVLLLFGSIGGATGLSVALPVSVLAANIPQVWVAYREKSLTDLSLGTWLLAMSEGLLWGGYGLVQQDIAVLVNNTFQLTTSAMIAALKLAHMARHAKQHKAVVQVTGDKQR